MSHEQRAACHTEVKRMLEEDVIEPSASDWRSAPVMVQKDGKWRFCVDVSAVNKVSKKDAYPSNDMNGTLDKLREAKVISKIDLKKAYHQIRMAKDRRKYTAFGVEGMGLFQFKRMPFGLCNAPATFMRLITELFGEACEPHVFAYLDDLIIVTDNLEEHLLWLKFVLEKLQAAGLQINRDKCEFCCSQVAYLGFLLDKEGLRPDPAKVEPVLNYPAPKNRKQMRRFLGMVGWYSRFLRMDSEIKIPLFKLLKESVKWAWGDEQQVAFEKLKRALAEAPVLARPDFSKPFTIQCDASGFAMGAVITQELDDGEHPIMYVSRVMTAAEQNYTTTERECLAMLWAIKKFRPYIEGQHFRVITDHSALKWLANFKEPFGRIARWKLEMQQWDFEIIHRKGALHHVPDALSRMYEDEEITAAFEEIRDEWYLKRTEEVQQYPRKYGNWRVEEGRLYRFRDDPLLDPITDREESWKLVVPAEYRERVLADAHREASSGHLGVEKTYDRVAREYYWPGVWHSVHKFVTSCDECQRYKVAQTGPQGLMGQRIVERPWAVVAADCMEFPHSKGQFKYLVVFQDLFTRWIEVKPLRSADGKSVAKAFEELVLFRWETPDFLLTDNGKEFDNKIVKGTVEEYGVKLVFTPPYHPQANPVERSNRTLKAMIATFVKADHRNWDQHLHEFRHAVNTAIQTSTRVSPAFLNFGRNPRPVKSLRREVENPRAVLRVDPEVWTNRMKRLDALRDLVVKHIDKANAKQSEQYNKGRKDVRFNVGDFVLRRSHVLSNAAQRFSAKLAPKYEGPFEVVEFKPPVVYVLAMGSNRRNASVHVSELKRYIPPRGQPPEQAQRPTPVRERSEEIASCQVSESDAVFDPQVEMSRTSSPTEMDARRAERAIWRTAQDLAATGQVEAVLAVTSRAWFSREGLASTTPEPRPTSPERMVLPLALGPAIVFEPRGDTATATGREEVVQIEDEDEVAAGESAEAAAPAAEVEMDESAAGRQEDGAIERQSKVRRIEEVALPRTQTREASATVVSGDVQAMIQGWQDQYEQRRASIRAIWSSASDPAPPSTSAASSRSDWLAPRTELLPRIPKKRPAETSPTQSSERADGWPAAKPWVPEPIVRPDARFVPMDTLATSPGPSLGAIPKATLTDLKVRKANGKSKKYNPRRHFEADDYEPAHLPARAESPPPGPPVPATTQPRERIRSGEELPPVTRGVMFGDLTIIPTNRNIDPPPYRCFNCWQPGHRRVDCKWKERMSYCYNCGRREVRVETCPRCKEAYLRYIAAKFGRGRSEVRASEVDQDAGAVGGAPFRPVRPIPALLSLRVEPPAQTSEAVRQSRQTSDNTATAAPEPNDQAAAPAAVARAAAAPGHRVGDRTMAILHRIEALPLPTQVAVIELVREEQEEVRRERERTE